VIRVGALHIASESASLRGQTLELRPLDLRVLKQLAEQPGRAIARRDLATQLWGPDTDVDPRTVDTCVTRIRKAMNGSGDAIITVRRVGYRLDPERLEL
jgi:DNA-binding response OmpR family regulator